MEVPRNAFQKSVKEIKKKIIKITVSIDACYHNNKFGLSLLSVYSSCLFNENLILNNEALMMISLIYLDIYDSMSLAWLLHKYLFSTLYAEII